LTFKKNLHFQFSKKNLNGFSVLVPQTNGTAAPVLVQFLKKENKKSGFDLGNQTQFWFQVT
jgi:hypothetical protein